MDVADIDVYVEKLKSAQSYQPSDIARIQELGSAMGFSESVKDAQQVVAVFNKIDASNLKSLPKKYLKAINAQANNFLNFVSRFVEFMPNDPNATTVRQQLISEFSGFATNVYNDLAEVISFQNFLSLDQEDGNDEMKERLEQKERLLDDSLEALKKTEKEFANVSEKMREQAAKGGVTQEATHFKDQAKEDQKSAEMWRLSVLSFSVLIVLYAIVSMVWLEPPTSVSAVINFVANKLMIFGALIYLLSVSTKTYMSKMHNMTVNTHRKNALLTYDTLVSGTANDVVKDKILEAASQCIYSHQETGFTKQGGGGNQISSVVEMMPKTTLEGKISEV